MASGFKTSVISLVTLVHPKLENGDSTKIEKKFGDSGAEGENNMAISVKI